MRITTPSGSKDDATEQDLLETLTALQRGGASDEDEQFVIVERGGEDALQMRLLPIEHVVEGRVYRAAILPSVLELFRRFAAGSPEWDAGVEWIDVTQRVRRSPWKDGLILAAAVAGLLAVAGLVLWWLLRKAEGKA